MQAEITSHPPVNHVFVDFENVKSVDTSVFTGKSVSLYLFLGPQNKKLDVGLVECLLENSKSVQMIRSPKSGKNALDFILAYHLGQAALAEPTAKFHIISKDTGFDALIDLLKSKNIKAKRHNDWTALGVQSPKTPAAPAKPSLSTPAPKTSAKPILSVGAEKMLESLKKSATNRPKKNKTLITHARNFSGKDKPDTDAEKLIAELKRVKALEIDEKGNVSYLI